MRAAALLVAAACLGLLAGCGAAKQSASATQPAPGPKPKPPTLPRLTFGYDAAQPLDFIDRGVVGRQGSLTIHDIVYVASGESVEGYLVERAGRRRLPAVVLVHGSGSDRRELLGDAVAFAQLGGVALTITEPSDAHPPPAAKGARALLFQSRAITVRNVVAIRRAADLLASLPTVDRRRLGYLGWSAGAKAGTYIAASDARFKALALLSAGADELSNFVAAAPPPIQPQVRLVLGSVDPLRYIGFARPGSLLLEDGTKDRVVPHEGLLNMIHAAPRGTVVRWYAGGHALVPKAWRDALDWLLKQLRAS